MMAQIRGVRCIVSPVCPIAVYMQGVCFGDNDRVSSIFIQYLLLSLPFPISICYYQCRSVILANTSATSSRIFYHNIHPTSSQHGVPDSHCFKCGIAV
ncbi:hypothetical protein GGI35DRAFT_444524 [Trichoderma velutinum]